MSAPTHYRTRSYGRITRFESRKGGTGGSTHLGYQFGEKSRERARRHAAFTHQRMLDSPLSTTPSRMWYGSW